MSSSERPEPRISTNDLALFMVSSDTARVTIIKRNKFPKMPPIIRYRDVRSPVITFLSDNRRDVQGLVTSERMFTQRLEDSSLSTLRHDDAHQSIEVLHAIQSMQNKLGSLRFSAAPLEQAQLLLSGVIVSVRLDLFAHGASRGIDQIGGAILRLSQDDADSETAKARRREMGLCVAALARSHLVPPRHSDFDSLAATSG